MAGKSKAAVAKGGVEKTKKTGKKAADAAAAATATATESSGKQKKAQKTPAKEEDIDDLFGKLKKTGPKAKDKVENDVNKNTNDGEQKSSKKKKGISNNSKVVGSKDDIFGTETGKGRKYVCKSIFLVFFSLSH